MKLHAKFLVVDTSAFIKGELLNNIGENVITVPEVIGEIRNKRQFRHLSSFTHDVEIQNPFNESLAFVTDFAKKTGDYSVLSATDIKLIALTYQLEVQNVGNEHLRKNPIIKEQKINTNLASKKSKSDVINGLCLPSKFQISGHNNERNCYEINSEEDISATEEEYETAYEDFFSTEEEDEENTVVSEDEESEFDEDGWITSSNFPDLRRATLGNHVEDTFVIVGCLTTDFAIQNVLMQIGLNVISPDGKLIKDLRTYILRCYACFKTTSNMKKVFCPNCGHKTLKRVSVYLDKEGNKCIFINFKKPISTRGKRFSLPMPRGGKHAVNPKLVEDARRPHQKATRLAKSKTNALHDDYLAGSSPFIMRDVHSRSAQLGFNKGKPVYKYWMRKNPNESKRMPKK